MELLASISKPTCNGRLVCAAKFITCLGGVLLSRILNWSCLRSRTNLPSLSTTVKTTLTSSDRMRTVGIFWSLESLLEIPGCWESIAAGDAAGLGVACCAVAKLDAIAIEIKKNRYFFRVIEMR